MASKGVRSSQAISITRDWSAALRPIRTSVVASSIVDSSAAAVRGEDVMSVISVTMVLMDQHSIRAWIPYEYSSENAALLPIRSVDIDRKERPA